MAIGNSLRIPHFLSASSPKGLERAMLKNNIKHGVEFHYFSINFVSGKWIAWFTMPADKDGGVLNEDIKKVKVGS